MPTMLVLVIGLAVLLGVHLTGVLAPGWRERVVARIGLGPWKLAYSAASIVGLLLVIRGYGLARADPTVLWAPPAWGPHATTLLAVIAFVLIVAAYVPGTHFKSALGHPMTLGVALWALGHLLANGTLRALILFGAFLAWSIVTYAVRRGRDRAAGVTYPAGTVARDAVVLVVGVVAALAFAFWLHGPLLGVRPFSSAV
ncbi:MAG: NnrU family protein [Rudaea sp.]